MSEIEFRQKIEILSQRLAATTQALKLLAHLLDFNGILKAESFAKELEAAIDRAEAAEERDGKHSTDRIVALVELARAMRAADSWSPSLPRSSD